MRNILLALGVSVAMVCAGYAQAEDEEEVKPVGDQKEHGFLLPFKTGTTMPVVWKCSSSIQGALKNGNVPKLTDMTLTAEMVMSVGKGNKDGGTLASVDIKRLFGKAQFLSQSGGFDTSDPESVTMSDGKPSYIACLKGDAASMSLDSSGKVVKAATCDKVSKSLNDCLSDFKEKESKLKAINEWVQHMAGEPYAYVPIASVKKDATWQVRKKIFFMDIISGLPVCIDEITECTLIDVKDDGTALVKIEGKATVADKDAEIPSYDITGAMRVKLDDCTCMRWQIKMVGRLKDNKGDDLLVHTIMVETMSGAHAAKAIAASATQPASQPSAASQPTTDKAAK